MNGKFPESDWKVWKRLSAVVVGRHCSRTLEEVASISGRDDSAIDLVTELSQYLRSREKDLNLFNELRRSAALLQIAAAYQRDLITDEELEHFSEQTRRTARELRKLDR